VSCDALFFFFKKKNINELSYQSGTTTCRSANIRYAFHNLYLIIRVTSTQRITHNNYIDIAEDTSINNIVNHKRATTVSICLKLNT
jgi:hypothetical protein